MPPKKPGDAKMRLPDSVERVVAAVTAWLPVPTTNCPDSGQNPDEAEAGRQSSSFPREPEPQQSTNFCELQVDRNALTTGDTVRMQQ